MRRLLLTILACILSIQWVQSQGNGAVSYCQYWIDQDNSNIVLDTISGMEVQFSVDATQLSTGLHKLFYRIQDDKGAWSYLHTWMFYVQERRTVDDKLVTKCKYWIDDSSAYETEVVDGQISFLMDASEVLEGIHTLKYQFIDNEGFYGPLQKSIFYKNNRKVTKISWYKYWWNNNEDKATLEYVNNDSLVFLFDQELIIPMYAKTDGYSITSTVRLHIMFGDDLGNVSLMDEFDISYPDVIPPSSEIEVKEILKNGEVVLQWGVKKDQVEDYNVYYSEDNQPFVLWLPNTTDNTAVFKCRLGVTYRFTVTARDKAGNREIFDEQKTVVVQIVDTD